MGGYTSRVLSHINTRKVILLFTTPQGKEQLEATHLEFFWTLPYAPLPSADFN